MPYKTTKDLNAHIKAAIPSERGRTIFMEAFNAAAAKNYSEERCFKIAWAVLKMRGYKKNDKGQWVK
jgi:cation transport regulator ChaB